MLEMMPWSKKDNFSYGFVVVDTQSVLKGKNAAPVSNVPASAVPAMMGVPSLTPELNIPFTQNTQARPSQPSSFWTRPYPKGTKYINRYYCLVFILLKKNTVTVLPIDPQISN